MPTKLRPLFLIWCLVVMLSARAFAPRATSWSAGNVTYLAALDGGALHLARVSQGAVLDLGSVPAAGVTTLAVGHWQGAPALLAARGRALLRFALAHRAWAPLGQVAAPIREILPAPQAAPGAVLLSGPPGTPAPTGGAVWWVTWARAFAVRRVAAIPAEYRPWQLCWTHVAGEQRLAVAVYKSTPRMHFPHNCMFLYAWNNGVAAARWLGSRLSRPYVDATHADLRADHQWRMVAVEETHNSGRGVGVYRPIGFGYEGEWRTEAVPGLTRVVAIDGIVILWGQRAGHPLAWRLLPAGEAYRLAPLRTAPPAPEALARVHATLLGGWWAGAWHIILLPT